MLKFKNQFRQALAATLLSTDLVLTLTDASLLDFPSASDAYLLTLIRSGTNQFEIVKATGKSLNQVNVIRAQEGTLALDFFSGDEVEIRLSAGAAEGWAKVEEGLSLDAQFNVNATTSKAVLSTAAGITPASQKLATAGAIKSYVDSADAALQAQIDRSTPVGSIVAWIPGVFQNATNGLFITVLTANSVAGANAYLNPKGWYVCDGSPKLVAGSPLFGAPGAYLPNLTDNRFLGGSTSVGATGGTNNGDHSHTSPIHSHLIPPHYHGLGTLSLGTAGPHSHTVYGTDAGGAAPYNRSLVNNSRNHNLNIPIDGPLGGMSLDGAHSHTMLGVIGNLGSGINGDGYFGVSDTAVTTHGASVTENRPQYLSVFYIIKAL